MQAVNFIDVGVAGGSEDHVVAERASAGGVGCRIMLTEIRFGFDDAGRQQFSAGIMYEDFSQQIARNLFWGSVKESTGQ